MLRPSAMSSGCVGSASAPSLPSAVMKRLWMGSSALGGCLAFMAASSVSSTARTWVPRSPESRSATLAASTRKPCASLYSSFEMRRPWSSIPLAYSSMETPTMLESRAAGFSCWAPTIGTHTEQARTAAAAHLKTVLIRIPSEYIGFTQGTLPPRTLLTLQDDHRRGRRHTVRDREPRMRDRQLRGATLRAPMQTERGTPVRPHHHFHVPPPDGARPRTPRQRLERRLLRRHPRREMTRRLRAPHRVPHLALREQSRERAVPLRIEQPLHARDVDQIDPDADDHVRLRHRRCFGIVRRESTSTVRSTNQHSSAHSKVRVSSPAHARHAANRSLSPLARTASTLRASASSLTLNVSTHSCSSASSARRSGGSFG